MYHAMKRNLYFLVTIVGAMFLFASPANAGHLFTQASSNTPVNLTAGHGIRITQNTFEGVGTAGNISLNFNADWGAGDSIKITIGSYTRTISYDSPLSGTTQTASALVVADPTLAAAGITKTASFQWTVIASTGTFTFTGYRIYIADGTFNGTGAAPINQSQVVTDEQLSPPPPAPPSPPPSFVPYAASANVGLAAQLDALNGTATGELGAVIATLSAMTPESQQLALKLMSPETSQAVGQSAMNTAAAALDTVQMRLDSVRTGIALNEHFEHYNAGSEHASADEKGMSSGDETLKRNLWLKGFGGKGSQDAKDGYAGFSDHIHGVILGYDDRFNGWTLGVAAGYAKTDVSLNDYREGDNADIETWQLTGYFGRSYGSWYLNGMITSAYQTYTTHRDTHLTGIADGDFKGSLFGARLLAGVPLKVPHDLTVTPYGGVEFDHIAQRGYTETGAGTLSLNVSSNSVDRVRSIVGTEVATLIDLKDKGTLRPSTKLNWRHEFNDDGVTAVTSLVGGGGEFETVGQAINRDVYGLSLGLKWERSERLNFVLDVTGERASGYRSLSGQLMGNWRF